jgi:hypothetical protein
MLITLPPGFGARALQRKRARHAARHRKVVSVGDPVQDLINEAAAHGYEGDTGDLQAMVDFCWAASPTDGMAEIIEELADSGLIRTPW